MNCSHANQSTYRFALGRKTTSMCSDCLARCEALGMTFWVVERRAEDRPFRAPWRDRLTNRDDTGRVA